MTGKVLRTPELRLAGALALITIALRLWIVRPLTFCGTPDACYYLGMAQSLASGHGFHARFLFDYQQPHPTLPNTGIEYWRPGISLLLLVGKAFGGVNLHSAILLTTLLGVLYAAAAWHIAVRFNADRRLALASFALCLLSPAEWTGSLSADSGLYYGVAVAWFLALFTVRRQGPVQDFVALLCVCGAYFIRNDAAMLLVPLLVVLWCRYRLATSTGQPAFASGSSLAYAGLVLLGFLVALAPMHLLYRAVLGTPFPSGAGKALYFDDLGEFIRYNAPVGPHTLLAHGWKHLLLFRLETLATVVYRMAALMIGYAALVFLPGLFLDRPDATQDAPARSFTSARFPELTGAAAFFAVALFAYALVLPAVGGFSALRTAMGIMPLLDVLVILALYRVCRTPALGTAVAAALIASNALAGLMEDRRDLASMNGTGRTDRAQAQTLARMGADVGSAIVMTGDPVQFSVTTGYMTTALPVNGLDAIAQAAHDLHATHVMLDTENLPAPVDQLNQQLQPVRSETLPAEHTLILALPDHFGNR